MKEWKGLVNYITMVETFKEGPHSTTPLRICMNSSLRHPKPVSMALNDCLMKGPSALVITVTLRVREHRYALTKDLSKIYQRVDAEPFSQHLRQVMWRGRDATTEMKVTSPPRSTSWSSRQAALPLLPKGSELSFPRRPGI
jgi:hypothetical protein